MARWRKEGRHDRWENGPLHTLLSVCVFLFFKFQVLSIYLLLNVCSILISQQP